MKRSTIKTLQILATLCLLAFVFDRAGLFSNEGLSHFIATLKGADTHLLPVAFLVGIVVNFVSSLKWYLLAKAKQLGAGFFRIFAYYSVGQFYNMFLPTSVGGDLVRAYELGKFSNRKADSLASVFVERYTGVVTLLLISAVAILSQLSRFSQDFLVFSLIAFTLGLAVIGWLALDHRPYRKLARYLGSHFHQTQRLFSKIETLLDAVGTYRKQPASIAIAFANSLLFYFFAVVNVYVAAIAFHPVVRFTDILIATPVIMLIMNIPLSLGNLGIMEFAYIEVLQIMGYDAQLGLAVIVLMRLKSLFDASIGGFLLPFFVTKKAAQTIVEPDSV